MRALGQRHVALCRFIQQYTQTHGWPPSRREREAALGFTSTSLVADYLEALARQGYGCCQPAISRGLVLTPAGPALAEEAAAAGPGTCRPHHARADRHQEPQGVPPAFERRGGHD